MRAMADSTALAQGLVFEDNRPGLLAVTLGASLVEPRHGQSTGRFENVAAVRVMALDTIHAPFDDWMMLGQVKLRMGFQMTLKTGGGIFARIDDKFAAAAAGLDVFAARSVTRLASVLTGHFGARKIES